MTIKSPNPLPEWSDRFVLPEGRLSDDFYRYLWDVDKVVRAAVDFLNIPPPPEPDHEYDLQEDWPVFIAYPEDKSYVLIQNNSVEREIVETVSACVSGTCTATFRINSTALGGSANAVSATENMQAHSSANILGVGDDLVVTISGNASAEDARFNIKTTRRIVTTAIVP